MLNIKGQKIKLSFEVDKERLDEVSISSKRTTALIKELLQIFEVFKKDYQTEILLMYLIVADYKSAIKDRVEKIKSQVQEIHYDLLDNDPILKELSKKAKDKDKLYDLIKAVGKKHQISNLNQLLKLSKIILDIKDFALGGNRREISSVYKISDDRIKAIGLVIFKGSEAVFKTRFYAGHYFQNNIFSIAEEVFRGNITSSSFRNLLNQQLQNVIDHYRDIQDINIGLSLFRHAGLDLKFTRWLFKLPQEELNRILEKYNTKLSVIDLIILSAQVNKNLEILKYMVYALKHTPKSFTEISKITGKSIGFIRRYEKLIRESRVN